MEFESKPREGIQYPIGGYAPGGYMNRCRKCNSDFLGDKMALECEPCAINSLVESHSLLRKKVGELESKMDRIKEVASFIKELFH